MFFSKTIIEKNWNQPGKKINLVDNIDIPDISFNKFSGRENQILQIKYPWFTEVANFNFFKKNQKIIQRL